jgi:plasmid maintenance system killer protein
VKLSLVTTARAEEATSACSWLKSRARAKLLAIDAAKLLDDLRIPPGNRLEAFARGSPRAT